MRASFLIFLAGPHGFFDKWDGFSDDTDVGAGGAAAPEMRNASQCIVTGCGCQLHVSRAASKGPWSAAGCGNPVDAASAWGAVDVGPPKLVFAPAAAEANYTLLLVEHADHVQASVMRTDLAVSTAIVAATDGVATDGLSASSTEAEVRASALYARAFRAHSNATVLWLRVNVPGTLLGGGAEGDAGRAGTDIIVHRGWGTATVQRARRISSGCRRYSYLLLRQHDHLAPAGAAALLQRLHDDSSSSGGGGGHDGIGGNVTTVATTLLGIDRALGPRHGFAPAASNFVRSSSPMEAGTSASAAARAHLACEVLPICNPAQVVLGPQVKVGKFTFQQGDLVSAVLGFFVGPFMFVYGSRVPAVLGLFNALWAAGFQSFLGRLSRMDCSIAFTPNEVVRVYAMLITAGTILLLSLHGGGFDSALKVALVCKDLSLGTVGFLAPFATRGDLWVVPVTSVALFTIVYKAAGTVVPRYIALLSAVGVMVLSSIVAGTMPQDPTKACDEYGTPGGADECAAHFIKSQCAAGAYGSFVLKYAAVIVPAVVVYLIETAEQRAAKRRAKARGDAKAALIAAGDSDSGSEGEMIDAALKAAVTIKGRSFEAVEAGAEDPGVQRQAPLVCLNAAMVGSGLLSSAFIGSLFKVIARAGVDPGQLAFPVQLFLMFTSLWIGRQQENFEQGYPVWPGSTTCRVFVATVVHVRHSAMKPMQWLDNLIWLAFIGKIPPKLAVATRQRQRGKDDPAADAPNSSSSSSSSSSSDSDGDALPTAKQKSKKKRTGGATNPMHC